MIGFELYRLSGGDQMSNGCHASVESASPCRKKWHDLVSRLVGLRNVVVSQRAVITPTTHTTFLEMCVLLHRAEVISSQLLLDGAARTGWSDLPGSDTPDNQTNTASRDTSGGTVRRWSTAVGHSLVAYR